MSGLSSLAGPGYWYMASPYSKWPGGLRDAYSEACKAAAALANAGVSVFSPIAHSHSLSMHGGPDPLDHGKWMPLDRPLMEAARGLLVLEMTGWDSSLGVSLEVEFLADRPVVHLAWPGLAIISRENMG